MLAGGEALLEPRQLGLTEVERFLASLDRAPQLRLARRERRDGRLTSLDLGELPGDDALPFAHRLLAARQLDLGRSHPLAALVELDRSRDNRRISFVELREVLPPRLDAGLCL